MRKARIDAGFKSIAEAARKKRFHKQNLADHEAGRRGISPDFARAYGKAFGIDPWWLLSGQAPDDGDDQVASLTNRLKAIEQESIDIGDLGKIIEVALEKIIGDAGRLNIDQVTEAAAAAGEIYSSLGKITTRRGVARIREALKPPLANLLELHGQPPADDDLIEVLASVIAITYSQFRALPASVANESQ